MGWPPEPWLRIGRSTLLPADHLLGRRRRSRNSVQSDTCGCEPRRRSSTLGLQSRHVRQSRRVDRRPDAAVRGPGSYRECVRQETSGDSVGAVLDTASSRSFSNTPVPRCPGRWSRSAVWRNHRRLYPFLHTDSNASATFSGGSTEPISHSVRATPVHRMPSTTMKSFACSSPIGPRWWMTPSMRLRRPFGNSSSLGPWSYPSNLSRAAGQSTVATGCELASGTPRGTGDHPAEPIDDGTECSTAERSVALPHHARALGQHFGNRGAV